MTMYQDEILTELKRKMIKARTLLDALELLYVCDPYRAQQYEAIGLSNMSESTARNMIKEAQRYGFTA